MSTAPRLVPSANVVYNTMPAFVPCGKRLFKTMQDAIADLPGHMGRVIIAAFFVFDGASMPWFCWSILRLYPTHPLVVFAAYLHDAAYRSHLISRAKADWMFYKVCRAQRLDKTRAVIMYVFLRAFGWRAYRRHRSTIARARTQVQWFTNIEPLMDANVHQSGSTP